MKKVFVTFVALLVVFVLTVTASESKPPVTTNSAPNDYNCSQVMNNLFVSCVDYLIGGDAVPSGVCCQSVNAVKASTQTQIQRVAACMCYYNVATKLPFLLEDRAGSLSTSCAVDLGFIMSANTDCANVPVSSRQGRE
uniref:Non-specific lipid-transfer protein n=1 Tax=Glycine max TaxID=3847 RepID=C6T109_SOYBN|nr:unknown [Glycine max]